MNPDRATYDRALLPSRLAAFAPGEFVGQESFMRASEIMRLASAAGVSPGSSVLDLCCGVAGPGRLLTSELGCRYQEVDADAEAIALARERSRSLGCTFDVGTVPPLPTGRFDVVLLLETMLAFADKEPLIRAVGAVLPAGGRFACTVEVGPALSAAEAAQMPNANTVWPVPLDELVDELTRADLHVTWLEDCTEAHQAIADSLIAAFTRDASAIAMAVGPRTLDSLLESHRLWTTWLRQGRIRKVAVVAEQASGASRS